jgi:hypothetical protein
MTAPLQMIALSFNRDAGSEDRILAEVDRLRGRGVLRLLGISRSAAKERAARLYNRLGVHSRAEAVSQARSLGLISAR